MKFGAAEADGGPYGGADAPLKHAAGPLRTALLDLSPGSRTPFGPGQPTVEAKTQHRQHDDGGKHSRGVEGKVKVEKIVTLEAPIEYAQCIAGENACPPEDVGGSSGYEEFLEALADPDHLEHADQKERIGRPFDPHVFDIDEINARLHSRE